MMSSSSIKPNPKFVLMVTVLLAQGMAFHLVGDSVQSRLVDMGGKYLTLPQTKPYTQFPLFSPTPLLSHLSLASLPFPSFSRHVRPRTHNPRRPGLRKRNDQRYEPQVPWGRDVC